MWNVKATVIPVITGAIGTISISLRKYLSNIQGKHEIKVLRDRPPVGLGHEVCFSTSHDTPQSVGLLWTSDHLVAETST